MTGCRCWKPACPTKPAVTLQRDWWNGGRLPCCPRHETVARYVTGIRDAKVPRQRDRQMVLDLNTAGVDRP